MNNYPLVQGGANFLNYLVNRRDKRWAAQENLNAKGRERQHQMMLENMKNELWKRRLREETQRQSMYQQRLLEQYKANQAAEVEKERLKGIAEKEKWEREAPERELEAKLTQAKIDDLLNKAAGKGGYAKKGGSTKNDDIKRLSTLLELKKAYGGRLVPFEETTLGPEGSTTTKSQKFYGQQESEMNYVDKLITDLTSKIYGKQFLEPSKVEVPKPINPYENNLMKVTPEAEQWFNMGKKDNWKDYLPK